MMKEILKKLTRNWQYSTVLASVTAQENDRKILLYVLQMFLI